MAYGNPVPAVPAFAEMHAEFGLDCIYPCSGSAIRRLEDDKLWHANCRAFNSVRS
jgi:hypothetical protein